jgi:catechol 2,3-dioxygenase-like lactoylglutathione lyase family enzyme
MQITDYLHTALLVSDLKQAEHFYGTVLGLPKVDRPLNYPGVWYQLGSVQVHLMVDSGFSTQPRNAEKWGRDRHLAFAVVDLQVAKDQLVAQGYRVQMSASGRAALFVQDPDGNLIELNQAAIEQQK